MSDSPADLSKVSLRDLVRARTKAKARTLHRQWFCFDPSLADAADAARHHLATLIAEEAAKHAGRQVSSKYMMPTPLVEAEQRFDTLAKQARAAGAEAVFQSLSLDQIEEIAELDTKWARGRAVLLGSFVRWEDGDGNPLDPDILGRDDLAALLDPEVLSAGEWYPLADRIMSESTTAPDRPTSLPQ